MDCNDARLLLEANADGELDPVRQLELEAHLRACPECALRAQGVAARRAALQDALPRFTAPPQLREKILAALPVEQAPSHRRAPRPSPLAWPGWNLAGLAASLAVAWLIGYTWGTGHARANALLDEAIADHVRSLQAGHLMDVVSTDQHTVKPWFAGKLDFSPPVIDLTEAGFPLAGGRLEHIDGRPAAALIFHRRLHAINLFIWPAATEALRPRQKAADGYTAESWSQGGMNFLAVSEIPSADLDRFIAEYRKRIP
jgi:anti-sigma factor RsiW